MLLTIPVSTLLDSQLDIGVDPLSGKFSYSIQNGLPRQQYIRSSGNLMLTLQSSTGDSGAGICLRVCTRPVDAPHQIVGQDPELAAAPNGLACQSDQYPVHSADMSIQSITDVYKHDSLTQPAGHQNLDSGYSQYRICSTNQGIPEQVIHEESSWEIPPPFLESNLVSPISNTLSLITSGSIFEGHGSPQYDANCTYVNTASQPIHNYLSEFMIDVIDSQVFHDSDDAAAPAPCASLRTMFLPSPSPQQSVSSLVSSGTATVVTDEDDFVESWAWSDGSNQEASTSDAFPASAAAVSISDGHSSEPRLQSQEGNTDGYPCPVATCGRVLKSLYTQQLHMKTHTPKPRKTFPCTMGCSESFTRHHDRLRHEVSQHGKQCEFSCKRCDRYFSSQRMLNRHTCWSSRVGPLRWQLKDCHGSNSGT